MASIGCDGTTPAMYKVGKDIKAGTYTITPDGSGKSYYAVASSPEAVEPAQLKKQPMLQSPMVNMSISSEPR